MVGGLRGDSQKQLQMYVAASLLEQEELKNKEEKAILVSESDCFDYNIKPKHCTTLQSSNNIAMH